MRKFINIINENSRSTKTKTATDDLSSLNPLAPADDANLPAAAPRAPGISSLNRAGSEGTKAAVARAASSDTVRDLRNNLGAAGGAHALMRDLENMGNMGRDQVSDADALALAGTTAPTRARRAGVPPQQLAGPTGTNLALNPTNLEATPDNLPAIVAAMQHSEGNAEGEVMSRGALAVPNSNVPDRSFDPEWHMVRDLPAYILNGVRMVARQIFGMWTSTNIEDIQMMCTLLNPAVDVQKMAAWIVNKGEMIHDCAIDFQQHMPSYAALAGLADCKIYAAGGFQFLIMRDNGGVYIYGWPESDGVLPTDQIAGPQGGAPQLGGF
jgi:hypothetical protein